MPGRFSPAETLSNGPIVFSLLPGAIEKAETIELLDIGGCTLLARDMGSCIDGVPGFIDCGVYGDDFGSADGIGWWE